MKNSKRNLMLYGRGFKTLVKSEQRLMPATLLGSIVYSIKPFIGVYFSAKLLNELASKKPDGKLLVTYAVLTVTANLICNLIWGFLAQLNEVLMFKTMYERNLGITVKCCEFDYTDMEDPYLREKKEKNMDFSYNTGILAIQAQISAIFYAVITIVLAVSLTVEMFAKRASISSEFSNFLNSPYIVMLIGAAFIAIMIYNTKAGDKLKKLTFNVNTQTEENFNHIYYYVKKKCINYLHGKDLRLYNQKSFIKNRISHNFSEVEKKWRVIPKAEEKYEVSKTILNESFSILIYLFVGLKALYGAFGIGNILMYVNAIDRLREGILAFAYGINSIIRNTDYLKDYFDFIDRPNSKAEGNKKISSDMKENYTIEFKNVSFHYPGSEVNSLEHVNCKLNSDGKIAVVGRNGSGKSTFIKLLCRLYDPQEGEILLNGTNIKEYDYEDYQNFFSVVFQDFYIFSFTIAENVGSGLTYDSARVKDSLIKAGFGDRLKTLPDGITTQLYNDFAEEGVEISGGEAQKIAIARALYKNSPYVILDEPTAALDPLAEADIYQRLNSFIEDKGAIYISHRLSSCYFCNKIIVFDNAKLVEQGTHNELLKYTDGYYNKMWNAQAQYYR